MWRCVLALGVAALVAGEPLLFKPRGGATNPIQCPDHQGTCPTGSTCCLLTSGKYGCCPFPQATCCSDHLHCCPEGSTCDLVQQTCVRGDSTFPMATKIAAMPPSAPDVNDVVCPGGTSYCPGKATCCPLPTGGYGCCPLLKAVCCPDKVHCCPAGYSCDTQGGTCHKGASVNAWLPVTKQAKDGATEPSSPTGIVLPPGGQKQSHKKKLYCPGGLTYCEGGRTCCYQGNGHFGCCSFINGTCCSDMKHCCPLGFACDVKLGKCTKGGSLQLPWGETHESKSQEPEPEEQDDDDEDEQSKGKKAKGSNSETAASSAGKARKKAAKPKTRLQAKGKSVVKTSTSTGNKAKVHISQGASRQVTKGSAVNKGPQVKVENKAGSKVISKADAAQKSPVKTPQKPKQPAVHNVGKVTDLPPKGQPKKVVPKPSEKVVPKKPAKVVPKQAPTLAKSATKSTIEKKSTQKPQSKNQPTQDTPRISVPKPAAPKTASPGEEKTNTSDKKTPVKKSVKTKPKTFSQSTPTKDSLSKSAKKAGKAEKKVTTTLKKQTTPKVPNKLQAKKMVEPKTSTRIDDGQPKAQLPISPRTKFKPRVKSVLKSKSKPPKPVKKVPIKEATTKTKGNKKTVVKDLKKSVISKTKDTLPEVSVKDNKPEAKASKPGAADEIAAKAQNAPVTTKSSAKRSPETKTVKPSSESPKPSSKGHSSSSTVPKTPAAPSGAKQAMGTSKTKAESKPASPQKKPASLQTKPESPQKKLASPQTKPASPQTKPASPQTKPASPQTKPASPQTKPASPQTKLASPQKKLPSPQTKLTSPQKKPASPQTKPASPQTKPASLQTKPASPQTKPASPQTKPPSPQTKPASPQTKSASPQTKPQSPQTKPASPQTKPASPQTKPASPQTKPASPQTKPTSPQTKPASPSSKPGNQSPSKTKPPTPDSADSSKSAAKPTAKAKLGLGLPIIKVTGNPRVAKALLMAWKERHGKFNTISKDGFSALVKAVVRDGSLPQTQPLVASIICPDGQSECPDTSTCCLLLSGEWGCCPLVKAVCCSDHLHCCPQGSVCDVAAGSCNTGTTKQPWTTKQPALPRATSGTENLIQPLGHDIICPDSPDNSMCPDNYTCCRRVSGAWGCCPMPKAVCCSDHLHCCPHGSVCNVAGGYCQHGASQLPWSTKRPALPRRPDVVVKDTVKCGDQKTTCPVGTTCCQMLDGNYGCCPFPNALCCADKLHCCPSDQKCDIKRGTCTSASGPSMPWGEKLPAQPVPSGEQDVLCPDQTSMCPQGSTCCPLSSGGYGCCPLAQAVCCQDHTHCCPHGYTCDTAAGTCSGNGLTLPWYTKTDSRPVTAANTICPDQTSTCPAQTTCCLLSSGQYGCCPLPHAVCCQDKTHCCPSGYTCDPTAGTCSKNGLTVPWYTKTASRPITSSEPPAGRDRPFTTPNKICPDQTSSCPDQTTCCVMLSGQYGCCPLPSAVCCADKLHCCPASYKCDVTHSKCLKSAHAVPWAEKTAALPVSGIASVVCPDKKSQCQDGYTCCKLPSAEYGCCPLPKAVCCSDGLHCCPEGTTCDATSSTCRSNRNSLSVSSTTVRRTSSLVGVRQDLPRTQKCDAKTVCPDSATCCLMKSGQYGCCPYVNASCCVDKVHCCPSGFKCDPSGSRCIKKDSSLTLTSTMFTRFRARPAEGANDVLCPGGRQKCAEGTTCCRLHSGDYGCCPFSKAVCCSDGVHCCPQGFSCDPQSGTCTQAIPWLTKIPAVARQPSEDPNYKDNELPGV